MPDPYIVVSAFSDLVVEAIVIIALFFGLAWLIEELRRPR